MRVEQEMMVYAYGIYLEEEKNLAFSTRRAYQKRASKFYENPGNYEEPPHLKEAEIKIAKIRDERKLKESKRMR
jgi:hypothetical protein